MTEDNTDDPTCSACGKKRSKHDIDQYTGEPTKCPIKRGTDGLHAGNNEHLRERENMQEVAREEPICTAGACKQEAEYTERSSQHGFRLVCDDHVDPTKRCSALFEVMR